MKDYSFMISDDRFHKTRFFKKEGGGGGRGGANQNFPHKKGDWSKGGGLEQFRILRGGLVKKRG